MDFLADVFSLKGGHFAVNKRSCCMSPWLVIQGAIYMMYGLFIEFMPSPEKCATIMDCEPLEGWIRGVGFTIFHIGLFYLFAGLADNKQFAAVSVVMRCIWWFPIVMVTVLPESMATNPVNSVIGITIEPSFALITFVAYQFSVAGEEEWFCWTSTCFFSDVFSCPGSRYPVTNRSVLGTWSMIQGALYMVQGAITMFNPIFWSAVMLSDEESAAEGFFFVYGLMVCYLGLLYIFAGIADNKHFAAVSIVARCIFVPILFSGWLGGTGAIPPFMATYFGLSDPALGIITYVLYKKVIDDGPSTLQADSEDSEAPMSE